MKPKSWNDILALILIVGIPALWVLGLEYQARNVPLDGEIKGALILAWGLIIQYYFRKAPPNGNGGG